ncbi:MAG: hypothetical protein HC817_03070 [Saprospiraceae bacterium]|nr:hypothetical protein [Saprospiraceae bacterium]
MCKKLRAYFLEKFAQRGQAYRWFARAFGNNCADTVCVSEWSEPQYFSVRPEIKFTNDLVLCNDGDSVTLAVDAVDAVDAVRSNVRNGVRYEWFLNDTLLSNENSPTIEAKKVGSYRMRVILKGGKDCDSIVLSTLTSVNVSRFFASDLMAIRDTTVQFCVGSIQRFVAAGANTYVWKGENITNNPQSASIIVKPTQIGDLIYSVTGMSGNCRHEKNLSVRAESSSFSVKIDGKDTICLGQPVRIIASGAQQYVWSIGSTTRTTDSVRIARPLSSGSQRVEVRPFGSTCDAPIVVNYFTRDTPFIFSLAKSSKLCR